MTRRMCGVAAAMALASAVQAQDVGGTYSVQGTNPNGSSYTGTAEIAASSDTTCTIDWMIGNSPSSGICMRDGNALAVGYTLGEAVGLGI